MITEYTKRLGEKLYHLRTEKDLSLRELAEKASSYMEDGKSISHTSINKYENLGRAMDLDILFAICKALNVDPIQLLEETMNEVNAKKSNATK